MAVKIDKEKCAGCGPCVEACPVEALKIEENLAIVDVDTCIDCGACVEACPSQAISA